MSENEHIVKPVARKSKATPHNSSHPGYSRRGGRPPLPCYITLLEMFRLTQLLNIKTIVIGIPTIEPFDMVQKRKKYLYESGFHPKSGYF